MTFGDSRFRPQPSVSDRSGCWSWRWDIRV